MQSDTLLSLKNPLISTWILYASILGLKMLLMSILTGKTRYKHKAFANAEDSNPLRLKPRVDENVERVRRAHLNDIENILVFIFVSFGYILTNPAVGFATLLFRVFTIARITHTLVYAVVVIPQPARALSWGIGYAVTIYMAFQTLLYFSASY